MDKNVIKKYAVWARRELIMRVAGRAAKYGITEDDCGDIHADSVDGRVFSSTEKEQRKAFIENVHTEGYEQAVEEVAYTWFNRFCALRYMEVNGYLPTHIRVFTNDAGEFKPQILDEAIHLELAGLSMERVFALKEANETDELYRYLLITHCNALSWILPGMFQKIADYTELLMPDNLLREGSVIERMVAEIPEEDWTDQVQIIGWLYQYYNAEKKDEVFAALKKNVKITKENIPAATQLFTPDWIVRYMVENSLGRLWVEGHPNEELKSGWQYYLEEAEQEPEVEAQLAEIRKEYVNLKPEDIKCIDPCCGSGHILIYMFDVLMQIYESYGYTTQEAVGSIIENNLYGLDIDDRATQLAYFAVMMKAQSYDRRFFSRDIQTHVYAIRESTPINKDLLSLFGPYSDTVKKLLDTFTDAKEYGSLIEPDITMEDISALEKHMVEMDEMSEYGSLNSELFTYMALKAVWPLLEIAKLLVQKYDVVVTNPPYMGSSSMSGKLSNFVKKKYPDSKSDLFAVFIESCGQMAKENGYQAMITQPSFLTLSSFEKLRIKVFDNSIIISLLDMGRGIFGIDFGSTSFVFKKAYNQDYKGIFFNLKKRIFQYIEPDDIAALFLAAKKDHEFKYNFDLYDTNIGVKFNETSENAQTIYYLAQESDFSKIPGSPLTYWAGKTIGNIFATGTRMELIGSSRSGLQTGNNDLFLKMWFEVAFSSIGFGIKIAEQTINSSIKWVPQPKGGPFRKWYGNFEYVVNFEENGRDLKNYPGTSIIKNPEYYFKEGVSWSHTSSKSFSARYMPVGCIFNVEAPSFYPNEGISLKYILGFLNTKILDVLFGCISQTMHYLAGDMAKIPIIFTNSKDTKVIEELVTQNILLSCSDWDSFETSWGFRRHVLIRTVPSIAVAYDDWENECNIRFAQLKENEEELNHIFLDIYGLQDELKPEVEEKDVTVRKADLQREIRSLISYAVGCMFGRYSLDVDGLAFAGGDWDASMYQKYLPDYNGIIPICDDEYFIDDIVGHFIDFIKTVYSEDTLEENLQFIADVLGGSGSSREIIRKYFLNDFYTDHCKIYQKRPIYWLFDSGKKNGFKCLIYLHRYQPDTIARIRTDYVHEQQARYRTAIADRQSQIDGASTSERIKVSKDLKKLQEQSDELLVYEEKIHHLADQFIDINLNDGVKVNYAKFQDVLAKIK